MHARYASVIELARCGGFRGRCNVRERISRERISRDQPSGLHQGDGGRRARDSGHRRRADTRRGANGGRRAGCPHAAPRRAVARHGPGRQEPHHRGSLRVHVQEPAAAPGVGYAARPPGCDHGRAASADPSSSSATKDANDALNENPNPKLTSGFTFVGQFVDHDITFDTTRLSDQQSDPDATTNFRTPRYDLDAIYGRGPNLDPQFYDPNDRDKFLIRELAYNQITGKLKKPDGVTKPSLERRSRHRLRRALAVRRRAPTTPEGTAIIADPRNDQTLIVLQLHVAMQKFHNRLVDVLRMQRMPRSAVFESARRLARWHYQWIVTHQFLPAIVGTTMIGLDLPGNLEGRESHPQVLQADEPRGALLHPGRVRGGRVPLRPQHHPTPLHRPGRLRQYRYAPGQLSRACRCSRTRPSDNNLNGHRDLLPLPRLKIQWSKFFNAGTTPPTARPVRQFDASLADPLFKMPATALPDTNTLGRCRSGTSAGAGR